MLRLRGLATVRITKVQGFMLMRVWFGMVGFVNWIAWATMRLIRRLTLDASRVDFVVKDARRNFAGVCGRWYPVILTLHLLF